MCASIDFAREENLVACGVDRNRAGTSFPKGLSVDAILAFVSLNGGQATSYHVET